MNFMILNKFQAVLVKPEVSYVHVIITDVKNEFIHLPNNDFRLKCLSLKFDDWDTEQHDQEPITMAQARSIVNFVFCCKDHVDLIIVNCDGGRCRSAGVVAALAKSIGEDDSIYFKTHTPNMRVYRFILDAWYEKVNEKERFVSLTNELCKDSKTTIIRAVNKLLN